MSHPKALDESFESVKLLWPRIVLREDGCWEWKGARTNGGYGKVQLSKPRRSVYAHRHVYSLLVGTPPEGADLHHACENKWCVNPGHLRALARAEHLREHPRVKNRCKRGHDFSDVYVYGGQRQCRPCALLRAKENRESP